MLLDSICCKLYCRKFIQQLTELYFVTIVVNKANDVILEELHKECSGKKFEIEVNYTNENALYWEFQNITKSHYCIIKLFHFLCVNLYLYILLFRKFKKGISEFNSTLQSCL